MSSKSFRPTSTMSKEDIARTLESENVKRLNDTALSQVMLEFSLVLPRHGQGWRATARTKGNLPGLEHVGTLEILCTDGIVAFYATVEHSLFYGHTQGFTGEVKPAFSLPKPTASAKREGSSKALRPKKEPTVSLALSLLSKLTQKRGSSS